MDHYSIQSLVKHGGQEWYLYPLFKLCIHAGIRLTVNFLAERKSFVVMVKNWLAYVCISCHHHHAWDGKTGWEQQTQTDTADDTVIPRKDSIVPLFNARLHETARKLY